jgi:hypothetical protein
VATRGWRKVTAGLELKSRAGIFCFCAERNHSYIVAIYLILVGLIGLNGIYHFIK